MRIAPPTCYSSPQQICNIRMTPNQRSFEMKSIQHKMVADKKNESAIELKKVKYPCKEFGFTAGILKGLLTKGRREK